MHKAEQNFCSKCYLHEHCGLVSRGLQHRCLDIEKFAEGYWQAVNDTAEWLKSTLAAKDKDALVRNYLSTMEG